MRQFTIDGHHLLLNGKRLMLRGYGDDHIYPEEMAMPSNKELHLARLRTIKSYGFNHVRHHSTMMPPEYYDACDEVGMICTAEFPIAYSRFLPGTGSAWLANVKQGTNPVPAIETYRREWTAAIKRFRNYPSIFCWVVGNEFYGGLPWGLDFKKEKNRLDPSRFFVDSDGVWGFDVPPALAACVPPGDASNILISKNDRDTLDLYFLQVVDPITYQVSYPQQPPKKPVVVHEMGNYLTFSRPDIIDCFQHNIKPFWLTAGNDKLKTLGLDKEAVLWAEKSDRLYAFLNKHNVETARKNSYVTGYHYWLFQDFWTTSNGLVDLYFRPKSISAADVLKYNNDVVLLQDGLKRIYRGRDKLKLTPIVSNYSDTTVAGEMVSRIDLANNVLATKTVLARVGQGEVHASDAIECGLPDVASPTQLRISAELTKNGRHYANNWSAWVYPAIIVPPKITTAIFSMDSCRDIFSGFPTKPIPAAGTLSECAIYAADRLSDPRVIDAMDRGATVLLLGPQPQLWPSYRVTFGTTWWKAGDSPQTNHTGTFVYDHPVTKAIAPDGWCDEGWFSLLEGASKLVLDKAPSHPDIIVRALPSMVLLEESSLLFEVRIGKGCMIVSGLNHRAAAGTPENTWLLRRLLEHAATQPKPKATWPASYVKCDATKVPKDSR
jgi:hypothetical protein